MQQLQVSQNFEESVKRWVLIDNKIKSAQDAIKELKKEKEKMGDNIAVYIKTNGLQEEPINITGGKLKLAISKTTVPMSRKYIESRLAQYFKSASKAKEVVEFLYSDRETMEKEVIRRTKSR